MALPDPVLDSIADGVQLAGRGSKETLTEVFVNERQELVRESGAKVGLVLRQEVGVPRHQVKRIIGRVLDENVREPVEEGKARRGRVLLDHLPGRRNRYERETPTDREIHVLDAAISRIHRRDHEEVV